MRYQYYICDVFTDTRFGGNQLAVFPNADGLSDRLMQLITREFNFSESTFVFPGSDRLTRRVRIFTPATEVPFAGHPNIGTAFVLAATGEFGWLDSETRVTFEEKAGPVPIHIRGHDGRFHCELSAPEQLSIRDTIPVRAIADALSLPEEDILTRTHPPVIASVGLPFIFVELKDRDTLRRARIHMPAFQAMSDDGVTPDIHMYVRTSDEFDIRARMFAPLDGVAEDPATGSACCALAGLLAHYDARQDGAFRLRISQGVEMGRPSVLETTAIKSGGAVLTTHVAGTAVLVSEGWLDPGD